MIYELNTDEFYAYGCLNESWAYINTEIYLKEDVDAVLLQNAVRRSFERMPYFKVRICVEQNPERLVLKTNEKPFFVYENDDFVPLDSDAANEYLITVSCFGSVVRIRFSHVLSDGVGANRFISDLMTRYFEMKYGAFEDGASAWEMSGAAVPEEYDNPYDYIEENVPFCEIEKQDTFSFSEDEVSEKSKMLIRIDVPANVFLVFSKINESSVASVAAWVLMNAMLSVKGEDILPIGVSMPFNMRGTLNCKSSMRNCNVDLELTMTDKLRKHDAAFQLSCLRGQIMAQTYDPVCLTAMKRSYLNLQKACEKSTVDERTDYYMSGDSLSMSPIVSYCGTFELGKYNAFYDRICQYVSVSGTAGIMMCILCDRETFRFSITTTLKNWDVYLKAIENQLTERNIPFSIVEERPLV